MLKNLWAVLVIFCICFICSSCHPNIVLRRNIICMIDYSGTIKSETLNIYAKTISDDVFSNLSESDKWMLFPIDEGSKISADHLLEDDMSQKEFDKGISSVTHRQQAIKKKVSDFQKENRDIVFNTVIDQKDIRKKYTNMTDILGAIDQISASLIPKETPSFYTQTWDAMAGNSERETENVIIIFSDMIHDAGDLNFQSMGWDENLTNKLITDLKAKKKIPDLKDAKIFICGRTAKDNKTIDGIKNFWTKFFIEAHADLKVYDYDSGSAIRDYMMNR